MIDTRKLSGSLSTLKSAISAIPYVKSVSFDTDSFARESRDCVLIIQYHPPFENTGKHKREMLHQVQKSLASNGLRRTQFRAETFGDRVYVFATYTRKMWRTFEFHERPDTSFGWAKYLLRSKTKDAMDYIVDTIFS